MNRGGGNQDVQWVDFEPMHINKSHPCPHYENRISFLIFLVVSSPTAVLHDAFQLRNQTYVGMCTQCTIL
jgi:hypothetical protein